MQTTANGKTYENAYTDFDEVAHTDKLHFFYDTQSSPVQMSFNGTVYIYVHNLQGDIVGLLDSTGALVVEYKYDAWGKPISTTCNLADTLGKRNPFRYRGYVYDEETGLYYVNSQYFNSETGRFVNADGVFVNSLLGQNLFCYCWNNSNNHTDSDGAIAFLVALGNAVIGAVVGAACSIAGDLIAGEKVDWGSAGKEAVK